MADRGRLRPFAAEFIATYTGLSCQDVTQDFELAFKATRQCCIDLDWDATVANMVYVWGGIAQVMNLRYYQIPGVGLSPNTGFQYLEPPENEASVPRLIASIRWHSTHDTPSSPSSLAYISVKPNVVPARRASYDAIGAWQVRHFAWIAAE